MKRWIWQVIEFQILSPADHDADLGAPEADLGVADAVDGAVFPLGEGGGVGLGVGVGVGFLDDLDEAEEARECAWLHGNDGG